MDIFIVRQRFHPEIFAQFLLLMPGNKPIENQKSTLSSMPNNQMTENRLL